MASSREGPAKRPSITSSEGLRQPESAVTPAAEAVLSPRPQRPREPSRVPASRAAAPPPRGALTGQGGHRRRRLLPRRAGPRAHVRLYAPVGAAGPAPLSGRRSPGKTLEHTGQSRLPHRLQRSTACRLSRHPLSTWRCRTLRPGQPPHLRTRPSQGQTQGLQGSLGGKPQRTRVRAETSNTITEIKIL